VPVGSSGVSVDDHWPKGSIARGVVGGGPAAAATRNRLEASSSHRLPISGTKMKKWRTAKAFHQSECHAICLHPGRRRNRALLRRKATVELPRRIKLRRFY
jgi:hypothetical protein